MTQYTCASNLSVFILASAITLVLNGLASFVCIPNCSNALYVFIHMLAVDSTTTAVHLSLPFFLDVEQHFVIPILYYHILFLQLLDHPYLLYILHNSFFLCLQKYSNWHQYCYYYLYQLYNLDLFLLFLFLIHLFLILIVSNHTSDKAADIYQSSLYAAHLYSSLYQHTPFNKQDLPLKRSRITRGLSVG